MTEDPRKEEELRARRLSQQEMSPRNLTEALIQADRVREVSAGKVQKVSVDGALELIQGYETRLKNQAASIENLSRIRKELLQLAEAMFGCLAHEEVPKPEELREWSAQLARHQEGG